MADYTTNFMNAMDGHTGLLNDQQNNIGALQGQPDPTTGGGDPKNLKVQQMSTSSMKQEIAGIELFNHIIADNIDPARALQGDDGKLGSAYTYLKDNLGEEAARELYTSAFIFNSREENKRLNQQQRLIKFYESVGSNEKLEKLKHKFKNYLGTNDANAMYKQGTLVTHEKYAKNLPKS